MIFRRLPYEPIAKARYRRPLKASSPSPSVLRVLRILSPIYLKFFLRFTSIELRGVNAREPNSLISEWKAFQDGKTRLILAFRHPYGDEPQVFSYLFDVLLKRRARRAGISLRGHPHARFIHGYEVALWGGSVLRWILPRIGAVPVYHVRADSAGIKNIRSIIRSGPYPIALAPEGQVSYRSETVPRLETGSAQMGFWCAEELERERRNEGVRILPLSVHHRFDPRDEKKVSKMIRGMERACGIDTPDLPSIPLQLRLETIDEKALSLAEDHYFRTYGKRAEAEGRDARWDALRKIALLEGERALGIAAHPQADEIQRVYRLRQECWDRIYSLDPARKIGALERSFADRRAGEAWFAMRHMEFVDISYYLDSGYLGGESGPTPSFDRVVETAINLQDLISRFAGGNISHRAGAFRKRAIVVAGSAIEIRDRFGAYKDNRKQAVEDVTAEMKRVFLECAEAMKNEEYGNDAKRRKTPARS